MYITMGSLSVYQVWYNNKRLYGVVDTIYQVVNSTYGYTYGFSILATDQRAYSSQNKQGSSRYNYHDQIPRYFPR